MTDDKGLFVPSKHKDRLDAFVEAIVAFDSNLGKHLGTEVRWTHTFKVQLREDGSWLALLGAWNEEGEPIIAFGNGSSLLEAWSSLGKSLAANAWRADRFGSKREW